MNNNLLLGVPQIDYQHRELSRTFQRLLAIDPSEESVADVLSHLTWQIHDHFKTEEDYMRSLGIPVAEFRDHEKAHLQIIEDLTEIHLETMFGLQVPFDEVIRRVSAYVNQHIIEFDLGLRPYIQRK